MEPDWERECERFCVSVHPQLVAALTHHAGDPELGQELAHEALVRVWNNWSHVRTLESPAGWAFRVGANLGNSWFRRRRAERRARQRYGVEDRTEGPDVAVIVAVRDALQALPALQREAVICRYLLGLSVDQTADAMGVTAGSVRGLVYRASRVLREILNEVGIGEEVTDGS